MSEERSWDQLTDAELVKRALGPASPLERELALKAIYDRHAQDVLGLCGYWLQDPDAAMDAAQSTFEAMIEDLPSLRDPGKVGPWLGGIAKNQCRRVWRDRGRDGEFPEQDLEDAEHEVKASRRRKAEVDRMLDVVAGSLTIRQAQIYQLVLRQDIRGQALAAQLGISEKAANDATCENQNLLADGFGAYVLARDGRRYCVNLGRILDQSGWDGATFSRLPRWLRRAVPRDPGPGTSIAIVAAAIAAAVVIVAVLVVAASALTSGNPAPQAGEGGTAVAQGGQLSSPAPASYNPTITGPPYVDSIPTTMIESHLIDVNLVKVIDPAQETNVGDVVAGNGYRLVALVFQLQCVSGGEYGETEVQISTSDGQQYSPVTAGIAGYSNASEGGLTISAGQSETIVIPYLLPDGVTVTGVEWKPYLHDAADVNSHGEWTVRE